MRNKIDYGNNMFCTQLLWAERTDRCCCTTISDSEYEQGSLPHCKCLYSERSDLKSDRAEAFTRSTYGAVAFLGSTANQYPEANHFYDMWLFAKLFDEEIYKLGDLNISAHIDNINTYYHGMFKDNAFSYICGGDPALELWTAPPQSFGNVELNESNGTIIITTECNGYYSVCISDEDGELLNTMYVNGNICSFNKPSGNFYIGINKHNYIPHVIYYNTDAETIQNVTFTFDGYYHHTPLAIGYGVSSDPAGNVTVKSGSKLIIENGAGGVYIDYGFKCEKGAVLDIK